MPDVILANPDDDAQKPEGAAFLNAERQPPPGAWEPGTSTYADTKAHEVAVVNAAREYARACEAYSAACQEASRATGARDSAKYKMETAEVALQNTAARRPR